MVSKIINGDYFVDDSLYMKDKKLESLIKKEIKRQEMTINLIASENYQSAEVLSVLGSPLANKYSEGYPGKRYYPGNEFYDDIEKMAEERVRKMFDLDKRWHVNVQPYSGSPANLAVYFSLLECGEKLMGMKLAEGGHLTHGHRVNFSGRFYRSIQYGVDLTTGWIDYDDLERLAENHRPRVIVSGISAYPRQIDFSKIGKIARKAGAYHVADISHIAGLVVAGLHPSPFSHSDVVVSTTHKTLQGPRGAVIICRPELADRIDRAIFPGLQGGPHNNQTAAIALMGWRNVKKDFKDYQKQILKNAQTLADELISRGFNLVTGGTDNHILLVDLRSVAGGMNGKDAERALENVGITANKNSIPGDISPINPSGLRLGTPAITARGMKEGEMKMIANWMEKVLLKKLKPTPIKREVEKLCRKFPLDRFKI